MNNACNEIESLWSGYSFPPSHFLPSASCSRLSISLFGPANSSFSSFSSLSSRSCLSAFYSSFANFLSFLSSLIICRSCFHSASSHSSLANSPSSFASSPIPFELSFTSPALSGPAFFPLVNLSIFCNSVILVFPAQARRCSFLLQENNLLKESFVGPVKVFLKISRKKVDNINGKKLSFQPMATTREEKCVHLMFSYCAYIPMLT